MMKKILLFTFLCTFLFSYGQNLDWFYITSKDKIISAENTNSPRSIAIDDQENIYIAGYYGGKIGFDESNPLDFQLISQAPSIVEGNCYLVKLDKNKKYLWHKTISRNGDGYSYIYSINLDRDQNIVIAGTVQGTNINLNPDSSSPVLYNTSYPMTSAIFVNKYSKNGDFLFGNFYLGGGSFPRITTDSQNDIIVTGSYYNYQGLNTDFDLTNQEYYLNGHFGFYGASFILKITTNGDFKWAKYVQGHNQALIKYIKTDHNDNIVFLGNNESFFDFNGQHTSSNITIGNEDYIAKITKDGVFTWRQKLGGINSLSLLHDSQPFDIDSDNSIVITTEKINLPIPFPNKTIFINDTFYRGLLIKIDENANYLWHSSIADTDRSQNHFPLTVSINSDHTINWTTRGNGVYNVYDKNELAEIIKGNLYYSNYSSSAFSFLMKFDPTGKLIYNKYKMTNHLISRVDKSNDKLYFAGKTPAPDRNPDQNIFDPPIYIEGDIRRGDTFLQKLDKCYSGTPDGDPYFYTCGSEGKKIKDLHPKTSYSSWYDSPTSTIPLSPETILDTKKYYAMTQDTSCPFNFTRLEVDVKVFQNPSKLVVPDFTFCDLQGKRLLDLQINNNQNIEFFDENMNSLNLSHYLIANKKYYVRQIKEYYPYISCRSDLAGFYVYDTSVAPSATNSQTFCKISNPKISNLVVTGINLKWYDQAGNILSTNTILEDNKKYFVTQTSGTCESAKLEITVAVNDPNPPTGNNLQDFCSAQLPKISDLVATGQNIRWYDHLGTLFPATTLLADGKTYYGTQTVNGCESTQKIAVTVTINNGGIPANDYSTAFCNDTTANTKNINLNDYKGNLIANPSDYSFEFFDAANQPVLNPANVDLAIGTTLFHVKVYNSLGCLVFVKLSLTLNLKPILNLRQDEEFCEGQSVQLNAGSGFSSYEWTKDNDPTVIFSQQIFPVSEAGKYTVKVTNVFKCENTAFVNVTKAVVATISRVQIVNSTATVILSNNGDFEYSLDNLNWQDSNVFSNLPNRNYTVFVRTKLGCIIGAMNFTIFSVANVFTPDADGINDTWKIDGLENYPNSEVQVYDRFGNMVLQKIVNGSFEWDGTFNSRKLPTGNYWYVLKVSDGRLLNGWVLLKNRN